MGNLGLQEIVLLVVLVLFIIPVVFFLITLQNTLKAVEPQNRTMQPGSVWLMLIPFLNAVWVFVVVMAIADSGKAQLEQYGMYSEQKPTYSIGLAWAICSVCNWIPWIGILAGLASIVLFVVYWIKVNELRTQLLALKQVYESREDGSIL